MFFFSTILKPNNHAGYKRGSAPSTIPNNSQQLNSHEQHRANELYAIVVEMRGSKDVTNRQFMDALNRLEDYEKKHGVRAQ